MQQPLLIAAALALSVALPTAARAEKAGQTRLVIVSSFPKAVTGVFQRAFEAAHPHVTVQVEKKKTTAGLRYLEKRENRGKVDLFWVSAPDAFEVLKEKKRLRRFVPSARDIPRRISGYPVNDPDGYYSGFAASGYGIMLNTDYLTRHRLTRPRRWIDLTRSEYRGAISLCAPSRSGTTHVAVEAILQLVGWREGWALIKGIAANAGTITQKSSHVPKGVAAGDFGIGIVIDFYALREQAQGATVDFVYPPATVLVPASIGILMDAPQPELAARFIEFLVSPQGQQLLLTPEISRLPIRPEIYGPAIPDYYPHPFAASQIGAHKAFDVHRSRLRYNVVNALFDTMITFHLDELRAAMGAVQEAESRLLASSHPLPRLSAAVARARDLIDQTPVDELTSSDPKFAALFTQKRKTADQPLSGRQGKIETEWEKTTREHYRQAHDLVRAALGE